MGVARRGRVGRGGGPIYVRVHHVNQPKTVPPPTTEGIERYLGSGLVKGIGPVLAKKMVERFEAEVLAVIENRTAELQTVDGIGPKRRERIQVAWRQAKQVREIMLFLHSHGVSTSRAVRIFKAYGKEAIEKVRSNRQPTVYHPCESCSFTALGSRTIEQVSQSESSTLLYLASNGFLVALVRSMS
jgi:ATP-dependent exoDNAse (exonuclease V) alpha subunit